MIGISKKELEDMLRAEGRLDIKIALNFIIQQCHELDPWIPIDENTPKDKDILLWCEFGQRIGYIDNHDGLMRAYGLGIVAPAYYQELPNDPITKD